MPTLAENNALARRAALASSRIRGTEPDPTKWRPLIEACEEDIRELVREYLKQAYHALRHRAKAAKEKGGPIARAEIAKLREHLA